MALSTYDITAEQGSDYLTTVTYRNSSSVLVNLTGYSARMQVRRTYSSDSAYLTLTQSSGLTLGGAAGTIVISISASAMARIPAGNYVYDLEIVESGGVVKKILSGKFEITGEVTK